MKTLALLNHIMQQNMMMSETYTVKVHDMK